MVHQLIFLTGLKNLQVIFMMEIIMEKQLVKMVGSIEWDFLIVRHILLMDDGFKAGAKSVIRKFNNIDLFVNQETDILFRKSENLKILKKMIHFYSNM
jgi:hypothetical protein